MSSFIFLQVIKHKFARSWHRSVISSIGHTAPGCFLGLVRVLSDADIWKLRLVAGVLTGDRLRDYVA